MKSVLFAATALVLGVASHGTMAQVSGGPSTPACPINQVRVGNVCRATATPNAASPVAPLSTMCLVNADAACVKIGDLTTLLAPLVAAQLGASGGTGGGGTSGGSGGTTPTTVASLVPAGGTVLFVLDTATITGHLYTDAAATTQAAVGGTVRGIKNLAGGSLLFTAPGAGFNGFAGNAGTLVAAQMNGAAALRFDGGTTFAESAATIRTAITSGQYVTIFTISNRTSGQVGSVWGAGNDGADEQVTVYNFNGAAGEAISQQKAGTAVENTVGSSGTWAGVPAAHIITMHAVASGGTMTSDAKPQGGTRGQASQALPAFATTWVNTMLGGDVRPGSTASRPFIGDIFIFAAFVSPAAPTQAERDAMMALATTRIGS